MHSPPETAIPPAGPKPASREQRVLPGRLVGILWRVRVGRDDCRVRIDQGDAPEQFTLWFENEKGDWRHGDTLIWHADTHTFDSPDRSVSFWHRSIRQQDGVDSIFAFLHRATPACQLMPFERSLLTALTDSTGDDDSAINQAVAWGAEEEVVRRG